MNKHKLLVRNEAICPVIKKKGKWKKVGIICYAETNAITERMQLNSMIAIIISDFFIP